LRDEINRDTPRTHIPSRNSQFYLRDCQMFRKIKKLTMELIGHPTVVNVPEFDVPTCDSAEVGQALHDKGIVILRSVIPAESVEKVGSLALAFIEEMLKYKNQEDVPEKYGYSVDNHSFLMRQLRNEGDVENRTMMEALQASRIVDIMAEYYRSSTVYIRQPIVRHQLAAKEISHVPWHQDGFALPADLHLLNCWMAISQNAVGQDSPGLELLVDRPETIMPLETKPVSSNYAFLEPDRDQFEEWERKSSVLRPVLQPGDAIVFDKFILHRTYTAPTMDQRRISAELRFAGDIPEIHEMIAEGRVVIEKFVQS